MNETWEKQLLVTLPSKNTETAIQEGDTGNYVFCQELHFKYYNTNRLEVNVQIVTQESQGSCITIQVDFEKKRNNTNKLNYFTMKREMIIFIFSPSFTETVLHCVNDCFSLTFYLRLLE